MDVTPADLRLARDRLRDHAVVTPLIENNELNARVGGRVFLKAENLQRTGSFKFRGAYNRLSQITADRRGAGVVAWSSGNHAQGVAAAAQILGIPATIVMPMDAPAIKADNTRRYGATVVEYDRYRESREDIARGIAAKSGAALVPSYDDPDIIAGQGTAGLEILDQATERGVQLAQLLVCCSGGGLVSGIATAFSEASPDTAIYAVEPEAFDDTARSLASGRREENAAQARSICDALQTPTPGELTFSINRRLLAGGLSVSDAEVREAMRFAFHHLKLVVEPGGAVALAALLHGRVDATDRVTGIVISGGNVDPSLFAQILTER
ncbi:L-threonine ammonia-lyase [Chromatocurvus halotolerans]|uniref:L-threonine ammonia-lyase n=2 Tax=Chromatocurvus halotolerans TaxID=1132028 RepID=A0A4R2KYY6_9GAMM|nr:L-threonine ammonia-lyase [Chromatocurvus halotolerans]